MLIIIENHFNCVRVTTCCDKNKALLRIINLRLCFLEAFTPTGMLLNFLKTNYHKKVLCEGVTTLSWESSWRHSNEQLSVDKIISITPPPIIKNAKDCFKRSYTFFFINNWKNKQSPQNLVQNFKLFSKILIIFSNQLPSIAI